MDPISLIVTALVAGATSALSDTAGQAVKDAYGVLKSLATRRLADDPIGREMIERHETSPDVWEAPLRDELQKREFADDAEIIRAAQELLELIDPSGSQDGKYRVTTGNTTAGSGQAATASESGRVYQAQTGGTIQINEASEDVGEWWDWPGAPDFSLNGAGGQSFETSMSMNAATLTQQSGEDTGTIYATITGAGDVPRQRLEIQQGGRRWKLPEYTAHETDSSESIRVEIDFSWRGDFRHISWEWPTGRRGTQNQLFTVTTQPSPAERW